MMNANNTFQFAIILTLLTLSGSASVHAQGPALAGVGPVNRSMAGAGTAAPLDAIGALHWNPASISALPSNEVSFGMELLWPNVELSSNLGVDEVSRGGISPIPSIGWVHRREGSPMTIGLGIYGIAGFKNNLQSNALLGGSSAYASGDFLQIAPTMSYALTDYLSVGVSPTITTATIILDPLGPSVVTPVATPGQGNRMHWGAGVQAGVYYVGPNHVHVGFSYKSQQWIEDLRFLTPTGQVMFDLDYPAALSLGLAYSGIQHVTFATDVRYFDWANTDGFAELGWSSTTSVAVGMEYEFSDNLDLRCGYNFNQSPITPRSAAANIITPLIQGDNVAAGFSYGFDCNVDLNLAYVYMLENNVTGPLPSPPYPPGATLNHKLSAQSLIMGVTVRY